MKLCKKQARMDLIFYHQEYRRLKNREIEGLSVNTFEKNKVWSELSQAIDTIREIWKRKDIDNWKKEKK